MENFSNYGWIFSEVSGGAQSQRRKSQKRWIYAFTLDYQKNPERFTSEGRALWILTKYILCSSLDL